VRVYQRHQSLAKYEALRRSPLTKEPLLKRRRSDSDNYSLRLYHVKITLHIQFVISLTSPDHIKLVNRKNYTENYTKNLLLCCNFCNNLSNAI